MRLGIAKKFAVTSAVGALIAVVIWAPVLPATAQAPRPGCGGQINTATNADAQSVNPLYGSDTNTVWRTDQIFDSLVTLDWQTVKPIPLLAESWQISSDGSTYTFLLRSGPKWPDGTPLTASDFAFTLQTILSPDYSGPWQGLFRDIVGAEKAIAGPTQGIEGIRILNDRSFQIRLTRPNAAFLAVAARHLKPIPAHMLRGQKLTAEHPFMQRPVGVGAYRLVEWVKGDHILFEAKPDYWGPPVCAQRLHDRFITDMNALALALESGDVDKIAPVSPRDLIRMRNNPNIKLYFPPAARMDAIYFNLQKKELSDVKVRQAVTMTVNLKEFAANVLAGLQAPVFSPVVSTSWAYDANIRQPDHDLEKAKALLTEAGYPNGFAVTVGANSGNTTREQMATYLQAQLAKIGIKGNVQLNEWSTFIGGVTQGKFEMVVLSAFAGVPDPDTLYADYHSKGASNYGKYSNQLVDQLLEQARTVQDVERRKAIYKEAQNLIVRDLPRASAYEYLGAFATRANISNVRVSVIGDFTGQKWDMRNWQKQ